LDEFYFLSVEQHLSLVLACCFDIIDYVVDTNYCYT